MTLEPSSASQQMLEAVWRGFTAVIGNRHTNAQIISFIDACGRAGLWRPAVQAVQQLKVTQRFPTSLLLFVLLMLVQLTKRLTHTDA